MCNYVFLELLSELILSSIWFAGTQGITPVIITSVAVKFSYSLFTTPLAAFLLCQKYLEEYNWLEKLLSVILCTFVVVLILTVAPFVMLVFIYPIWASSFLLIIVVISVTLYILNYVLSTKQNILLVLWYCFLVYYILFVYLLIFELLIIYGRGVANGGTFKTILTFLPSLFLPFIGWLAKTVSIHTGVDPNHESNKSVNALLNWIKTKYKNGTTGQDNRGPLLVPAEGSGNSLEQNQEATENLPV